MLRLAAIATGTVALGLSGIYGVHVGASSARVLGEFESLAANAYYHVVAEPLRLHPGMDARAVGVAARLARAGLQRTGHPPDPGQYQVTASAILYRTAGRDGTSGEIELAGDVVTAVAADGQYANWLDLPPEHLTSFRSSLHERCAPVEFADLPQPLVAAVLAAEDRRFFDHGGLDWRGIARAAARNVAHRRVVEGGSTITQQTVKIILGRTRRELPAKVDEAFLALLVERRFTKQQILQVYLNNVYLGHEGPFDVHGVAEGARFFFGKPLAALSESQMYELAAAIRAPNAASPRRHRERNAEYARAIAEAAPGVKTPAAATDAADAAGEDSSPTALDATAWTGERIDFEKAQMAYYMDVLQREWEALRESHRIEPPATLVASVDPLLQLRAAQALQRGLTDARARRPRKTGEPLQGAVVSLDAANGGLRALVGGADYSQAPFNRATNIARQVGSTFKPFVYLAAFGADDGEPRCTQSTVLPDTLTEYQVGDQVWAPANFDKEFRGTVTARQALEKSINAPTVALGMQVGVRRVAALARDLGVQERVPENPSVLLGALETSPLRLAGAYAALANGGLRVPPHALVEVHDEERVLHPDLPAPRRVLYAAGTYVVTDALVGALRFGTGAPAAQLGFQHLAAGKTGTSDDARDAWFVGYTPELVTAVWVGYDDNAPTRLTGASAALPVWVGIMRPWLGDGTDSQFDLPPGVLFCNIDPVTGGLANSTCPDIEQAAYVEGTAPQDYCPLHSPSFGDRWDRVWGRDGAQPESSPPRKRSLVGWLRDTFSL